MNHIILLIALVTGMALVFIFVIWWFYNAPKRRLKDSINTDKKIKKKK